MAWNTMQHINVNFLTPEWLYSSDRKKEKYHYRNEYTKYAAHKIAEFIIDTFPDQIRVKKSQAQWQVHELNAVLRKHLLTTTHSNSKASKYSAHLHTFHVIEWEHECTEGTAKARCTAFDPYMGKMVQVLGINCYVHCICSSCQPGINPALTRH